MNREILFRGKAIDNNSWVEGSLIVDNHPNVLSCFIQYNDPDVIFNRFSVRVNPDTVGQFTGLTDKNGVKIFEGQPSKMHFFQEWDMALDDYEECDVVLTGIIYYEGCCFILKTDGYSPTLNNTCSDWIEVIGTIHD